LKLVRENLWVSARFKPICNFSIDQKFWGVNMTDYERFGDYQPSEGGRSIGLALTFLFLGLGVGTAVALLFAPKSGKQMRRTLRRKYEDARDVIEDWTDQAGDVIGKGAGWANVAKGKVAPIANAAARRTRSVAER
jgi:gas vesicle protein